MRRTLASVVWWRLSFVAVLALAAGCGDSTESRGTSGVEQTTAAEPDFDIVVYGGTSSGVVAAVQAARMGKRVVLIARDGHIGGLATSGLTATDMNKYRAVGGVAREFYQAVYSHYQDEAAWRGPDRSTYFASIQKRVYSGKNDETKMQWVYESRVAEKIMRRMLDKAGVTLASGQRLRRPGGVEKTGARIQRVAMESGETYSAHVFVDASYTGDLMALAGVDYVVGRESQAKYGESHAGFLANDVFGAPGEPPVSIDPFVTPGEPSSDLLPFIDAAPSGQTGQGDARTQAYCYRVTMTDDPGNRLPNAKPEDYNPLWYEYLARYLALNPALEIRRIMTLTPMPSRKADVNGIDLVGAGYGYADGSYAERAEIRSKHRSFALGMFWFLENDARVPVHIRAEMARWGLPKDEFTDNGGFPRRLYVREGRRMVSDHVMTQRDAMPNAKQLPDPAGLASYSLDSHRVARFVDNEGKVREEGHFYARSGTYGVSYRSIRPRKSQCENLLVPVTLSASHVAYGSIRMEPVYMVLGQSAATAAVLSLEGARAVQDVPYDELRGRLEADGQILSP